MRGTAAREPQLACLPLGVLYWTTLRKRKRGGGGSAAHHIPLCSNSLIIVDKGNSLIRRLWLANLTMAATNVVGTGVGNSGNGGPASSARCNSPQDLSSDGAGGWLVS